MNKVKLLSHQWEFVSDVTTPFLGLVGGYRSGKTRGLAHKIVYMGADTVNKDYPFIVMEPTMGMVRRVFEPTMMQVLDEVGLSYSHYKLDSFILHYPTHDQIVWLLSSENYLRAQGISAGCVFADEIDLLKKDVAILAWETLISRLTGGHQQAACCSSPEGYNFLWDVFVQNKTDSHKLIRARTKENPFIPLSYFDRMASTFDSKKLAAYLDGEFVNLTSGNVYYNYDRNEHNTNIIPDKFPNHILHIGLDFNVNNTSGVVGIIDNKIPYIVDEFVGCKNTEDIIDKIRRRYPNREIYVYPDASGKSGRTNSTQTDHALLKNAGFKLYAHQANPSIMDRVNSVNVMFKNAREEKRLFVNQARCTNLVRSLEQQGFVDGKPDKTSGLDHIVDALGYFIWFRYPLVGRPTAKQYS